MKKKIYFIIEVLLTALILFSACQQTPLKDVVVNKADGNLIRIINSDPKPSEKFKAPNEWVDSAKSTSGNIEIEINADIITPDVTEYPVLRISPADITQENADRIIKVLMQDKPLYIPKGSEDYVKQEIIDLIIPIKENIAELESKKEEFNPVDYEEIISSNYDALKYYEKLYESVPDEFVKKSSDGKFERPSTSGINEASAGEDWRSLKSYLDSTQSINVAADIRETRPSTLYISKTDSNKQNYLYYDNYETDRQGGTIFFEIDSDLPNQKITLDEAVERAKNALLELGIDYMSPVLIASKPYVLEDLEEWVNTSTPIEEEPRYYFFVFTRSANGVLTYYVNNKKFIMGTETFNEDWVEEKIGIAVDDSGILSIEWTSPSKMLNIENSNVELLPFSEVQEKLKQQLVVSGAWNDNNVLKRTVFINKITLGMACIQAQNSNDEYLLVPVWDFYGHCVIKYKEGGGDPVYLNENNEEMEKTLGHSYLTINAIDGSVVYR